MWYYLTASLLYLVIMLMTFVDAARSSRWYFACCIACNVGASVLWFKLAQSLPDRDAVLINSAYWDLMIMFIGYMLPMVAFQFRLGFWQYAGLALVFLGFCLLKVFNE